MDPHHHLTPHEKKIVNENVGRLGAQLLREQVDEGRWPEIVLAVIYELSGQVLRLTGQPDDERTDPDVRLPSEAPTP